MIWLLDVGNMYYEEPQHLSLILLHGVCLAILINQQERHFQSSQFTRPKYEPEYSSLCHQNLIDALMHVWIFKMITGVNLFYLNEVHDERILSQVIEIYHASRKKSCIGVLRYMEIINMVKEWKNERIIEEFGIFFIKAGVNY